MTTQNKNVPALRFPEFSNNWEEMKLGEVAKIERGKFSPRPRNDPKYYFGNIPFVQTSDVTNSNGRIWDYTQTLNELGLKVSKLFPKGTILITIAANIGYTGILQIDMACPDSLIGITCKEGISNEFLNFYLSTQQETMDRLAPEGSQKNINIEFLTPYPVPYTSLPEQQKIASFLSVVDEKIQQLVKKKALLDQYKKGVMQKIFNQEIRFKDDNGKDFADWEEKKLGEVFKERSERGFATSELLSVSQSEGVIKRSDIEGKDNSSSDKSNYKRVCIDDIAYNSMRMWQGASGVSAYDGIVSPAYTVLIPRNIAYSKYFGYLFKTTKIINIFQRNSQGLTSDTWNLKYNQLSSIKIIIPSLSEQKKIADFLSAIDDKINLVNQQLENTKEYKKGLLQQMFI